jgi:hypothetical protein
VDAAKAEVLEHFLVKCGRSVLRVVFTDDATYDLTNFGVAQDDDEIVPHATAVVVRRIRASVKAAKLFSEHSVMFFSLAEVRNILDVATGALLFDVDHER